MSSEALPAPESHPQLRDTSGMAGKTVARALGCTDKAGWRGEREGGRREKKETGKGEGVTHKERGNGEEDTSERSRKEEIKIKKKSKKRKSKRKGTKKGKK